MLVWATVVSLPLYFLTPPLLLLFLLLLSGSLVVTPEKEVIGMTMVHEAEYSTRVDFQPSFPLAPVSFRVDAEVSL